MSEGAKKLCPACEASLLPGRWEQHVLKCKKVMASMLPARVREKRIRLLEGSVPEYSRGDFKSPTETQNIGAFGLGKNRKH